MAELWSFRELLLTLVTRELRLRYAQTWVGVAWVALKPLVTMALLWAIFGVAAGLPTDGMPRPVFFFSGLMLWFFFASAITDSKGQPGGQRRPDPQGVLSTSAPAYGYRRGATGRPRHHAGIPRLLLALTESAVWPSPIGVLWAIGTTTALALAIGLFAAAVNVRYRDATHVVPVALQLLMFASPIVYSSRLVPEAPRQPPSCPSRSHTSPAHDHQARC